MITIGKIVKSVGIKGSVKVVPFNSNFLSFRKLKKCFVGNNIEDSVELNIASINFYVKYIVLFFDGFVDINQSKNLVGKFLFVKKNTIKLSKNEWFIDDIIGCEVFSKEKYFGKIVDVLKMPANDVWVTIKDEKEILMPIVSHFIESVQIEEKKIFISHQLESLLEE